ncbi:TIM barrel protein [Candidatus Roseilinea sp. NK_OTU-006]|uniref:TIM barrel protein n=1 Tax=Candidatus Roseilinea sp. NK_OTU-006 TaxID=2704250 RepID=UPI00145C9067|nr:sugar phosphate isomerase/epimerase family protein [Candidatus Roseilinea sp. NK_OTU-006]
MNSRVAFGLSCYTFPFTCGFLRRDGHPACPHPMNGLDLVELAAQHGMAGVEFPLSILPDHTEAGMDRFGALLRANGMTYVLDLPVLDVEQARAWLPLAKRAGARVVRCMVSDFLEGARAMYAPDWNAHMREMIAKLLAVRPLLDELDMVLAIENHQDVNSDDLLALCQAGGSRVGVTLDGVNALAVAEEPYEFARRLGARIFNVHIKDYTIHPTPSGYNLVRASIGEGCIDWRAMLTLLREIAPGATWHIELAALNARHIRLYEDQWWRGYPPRDIRAMLPLFRFLARHMQPADAPWQTPWERGASAEECERYERDQLERTVRYLKTELADLVGV